MKFELKPYHRVELANGGKYIVFSKQCAAQESHTTALVLVSKDGWLNSQFSGDQGHGSEWDIIAVYDKPGLYNYALDPNAHGMQIWSLKMQSEKIAELKRKRDLLNDEISKLENPA